IRSATGVGAGNYFIANLTISINPAATPGTYIIESTTSPLNKQSSVADDQGHTFPIPHTSYTLTVVALAITSIAPDNQDIVLQYKGVPSGMNRIEASPILAPNSFKTIGGVMADASGMFSSRDMAPGIGPRFYRLSFP